jgi:hypothetical protein
MRREIRSRTATLGGAADLTVVAPVRRGFVPALDAVTYKSRVQRVLRTLHGGRQLAHEHDLARLLSDAVERVGRIQSIRIALIESPDQVAPDQVMLAVTFDGPWESYIRVIWQKVVRSLDLIFCNTEDYVNGWEAGYEAWCGWLRGRQAETPFLYAPPQLSFQDMQYLQTEEWRQRLGTRRAAEATTRVHGAEDIADGLQAGRDPRNLRLDSPADESRLVEETFRQGLRSLAGLYRLAELYLPGTGDGAVLHRAACELLREFEPVARAPLDDPKYGQGLRFARQRFADALDWLTLPPRPERSVPPLPATTGWQQWGTVQGGILAPYPDTWHGCVLLLQFATAGQLAGFLAAVRPTAQGEPLGPGSVTCNLALTAEAFWLAGLAHAEMTALPEAFVMGMARRAGLLGDQRANHPRRWRLPAVNAARGSAAGDDDDPGLPRTPVEAVHAVLQLRLCDAQASRAQARERLWDAWTAMEAAARAAVPGGAAAGELPSPLLSVQWTERQKAGSPVGGAPAVRDHFGYVDVGRDPALDAADAGQKAPRQVHAGEILLGRANAADPAWPDQDDDDDDDADAAGNVRPLLRDGSFLVVRKLRQDVAAFRERLASAAAAALPAADAAAQAALARRMAAKMMGRWPDGDPQAGQPLAAVRPGELHDFDYARDPDGAQCPLHAHMRLANPRDDKAQPPGGRPPVMVRRSMSWGPAWDEAPQAPRGLLFMAYVASLGEQFEVVQRWLAGGNGSGGYSGHADPLVGLPEPGRARVFACRDGQATLRVPLDGADQPLAPVQPLVQLDWGLYAFAPSLPALQRLARRAAAADRPAWPWSAERGAAEIERLRRLEAREGHEAALLAWKATLEDQTQAGDWVAASVWAAIRAHHQGLLRTPYGVLAASRAQVDAVLEDHERVLTVSGYQPRMRDSFGILYLGLDAGGIEGAYERESAAPNQAIQALTGDRARAEAVVRQAADDLEAFLQGQAAAACEQAAGSGLQDWEVALDLREAVDELLARACERWAGLDTEGGHFERGGQAWGTTAAQKPRYPGHFMAPSRHIFWPHPGRTVADTGQAHGMAVRLAMDAWLRLPSTAARDAPLLRAVCDSPAAQADPTYAARTLAGLLMGMVPTVDANLRRIAAAWLADGTLWRLRSRWQAAEGEPAREAVLRQLRTAFRQALQLCTAPDLLWRTAVRGHDRGSGAGQVAVRAGDVVVASLLSAAHACFEAGDPATHYAFGGHRGAPGNAAMHACPGYGPAQALMLGFFQALVCSPLPLRPGHGALGLGYGGSVAACTPAEPQALVAPPDGLKRAARAVPASTEAERTAWLRTRAVPGGAGLLPLAEPPVPPQGSGRILIAGDSWLRTTIASLASALDRLGYEIGPDEELKRWNLAVAGKPMRVLATEDLERLVDFAASFRWVPEPPRAILLSGGGNDLVDKVAGAVPPTPLGGMLRRGATTAAEAIDPGRLQAFLDTLAGHYRTVIDALRTRAQVGFPILLHGYDEPVPDRRGYTGWGPGPWLAPPMDGVLADDLTLRTEVMRRLIGQLNAMLRTLAQSYADGQVRWIGLAGTIAGQPDAAPPPRHRKYWHDELHPERLAADLLAWRIHAHLHGALHPQAPVL